MAQKEIPNAGTYRAKTGNTKLVVYEADTGSLCCALPVVLIESEIAWSGKTTLTLGKSDGTLNTRTIENLHRIFPAWDGDPFKLDELNTAENEFEVVCQHETFQDKTTGEDRTGFKVQWVNPLFGTANMPEKLAPDEVKSLKAKWASKFKAIAKPTSPAAKTTPAAPAEKAETKTPSRKAPVVGKKNRTSSPEEVMELLIKKHYPGDDGATEDQQQELGDKFYWPTIDKVMGEKNFNDINKVSPEQWGDIANKLGL